MLDRHKLIVHEPIKSVGTHEVGVHLHPEVEFVLTVEVVGSALLPERAEQLLASSSETPAPYGSACGREDRARIRRQWFVATHRTAAVLHRKRTALSVGLSRGCASIDSQPPGCSVNVTMVQPLEEQDDSGVKPWGRHRSAASRRTTSRPRSRCSARCCLSRDAIIDRDREVLARPTSTGRRTAQIYAAITSLFGQGEPADAVTVAEELRRAGVLEAIGGAAMLVSLQVEHAGDLRTPAATPASSRSTRCCAG